MPDWPVRIWSYTDTMEKVSWCRLKLSMRCHDQIMRCVLLDNLRWVQHSQIRPCHNACDLSLRVWPDGHSLKPCWSSTCRFGLSGWFWAMKSCLCLSLPESTGIREDQLHSRNLYLIGTQKGRQNVLNFIASAMLSADISHGQSWTIIHSVAAGKLFTQHSPT